jgi:hemerythrin-like domain-containing protein
MTAAIEIIKDEHRSIAAVLKALVSHVAQARDGRTAADVHLAAAMLDYLQAYPERLHHPKEDEYLFRFLRRRCADANAVLDDLEAQHTHGAELLSELRRALEVSRAAGHFEAFDPVLTAYAAFQWQHMRTEEEVVLPLAKRHLKPEDWQAIDAAFAANRERGW